MPCYDERNSASWQEKHVVDPLRKELDYTSGLLCELMQTISEPGRVPALDLIMRLRAWYEEHRAEEGK